MALAAAKARLEEDGANSTSALLASRTSTPPTGNGGGYAEAGSAGGSTSSVDKPIVSATPASSSANASSELPSGYVVIMTHCLPDGLGDIIFGENAVRELSEIVPVAWVRVYPNADRTEQGERLVGEVASSCCFDFHTSSREEFGEALRKGKLEKVWSGAKERFLAPWIFGLGEDEALLEMARRSKTKFWAFTEYGRSMGNIHTYTGGLGSMLPTGWVVGDAPGQGGVFRSVLRLSCTGTDWRRRCAEACEIDLDASPGVRLWWFYSRKDDEPKHDLRVLEGSGRSGAGAILHIAKVMPVNEDGMPRDGEEKTSGEKLADQLFQVAADPSFQPTTDVTCAEVTSGIAGQLSVFLWNVLYNPQYLKVDKRTGPEVVDIVVAPNFLTRWREKAGGNAVVAKITHLEFVLPDGSRKEVKLERQLYVYSGRVPRQEMRTFLDQCEECVFTTGDQSLAEAMLMNKLPCIKPDAKVSQWERALTAKLHGILESVPDLGATFRSLVQSQAARDAARKQSEETSKRIEFDICQQLGGLPPQLWNPTHMILAKAGMLG